jgi:hypothetical protein
MAEIKFYANLPGGNAQTLIDHTQNSGIGFYGSSFGVSVPIGQVQSTTFVTNANGTAEGVYLNNTQYANDNDNRNQFPGKVIAENTGTGPASPLDLNKLPNHLCPLNIRFTHTESVRLHNCKLRIFDRNDINNHASGVVTYVYEARHPLISQTVSNLAHKAPGRTNDGWVVFDPTLAMADMAFTNSPGSSGLNTLSTDTSLDTYYANNGITPSDYKLGAAHRSLRHDWYVALSSEPITIGSKTQYGLYFSVEYL